MLLILNACGIEKNIEATETMKKGVYTEIVISSEAVEILGEETIIEISYPQVFDMKDRKIQKSVNQVLKDYAIKQQELLRQSSNILYTDYETAYVDDKYLSILFKYGMSANESDSDGNQLFSSINVDLTTGMFITWEDFIKLFDDVYTADDKALLSFRIDEIKTDEQINPLQNPTESVGMYIDENELVVFYYDGKMQEIAVPKHTIPFMFPEFVKMEEKNED